MNENDGNRYLLIVIDVFSRYLWVEPLKSKTGSEVKKALQKIFNRSKVPEKVRSAGGSEFSNKEVGRLFKQNGIYHHIARSSAKACYAERVIQQWNKNFGDTFLHTKSIVMLMSYRILSRVITRLPIVH